MAGTMVEFPSNGHTAKGYLATPGSGKGPGVLVIQEWWGLVGHIKAVCDRFAAAGFSALAPDMYHGKTASEPDGAGKLFMALNIAQAEKDLARMDQLGFGTMPVCMAKTHLSLTHDPTLLNRPRGWRLPVRGVVPSAGAGFVVVLCGDMQRMPGLGRTPAFMKVDIDEIGRASCRERVSSVV